MDSAQAGPSMADQIILPGAGAAASSDIPPNLVDASVTAGLTYNWIKGHGGEKIRVRKGAGLGEFLLVILMTLLVPAGTFWVLCNFVDVMSAASVAVIFALTMLILMYIYVGITDFIVVPSPVNQELLDWKHARLEREFWKELHVEARHRDFVRECAELVAWLAQTGPVPFDVQPRYVSIARKDNEFGVDILSFNAGDNRWLARCYLNENPKPVDAVRCFAGSKAYFKAKNGIIFSFDSLADRSLAMTAFTSEMNIKLQNIEDILALAHRALKNPSPSGTPAKTA
jgi:hypothetical protein